MKKIALISGLVSTCLFSIYAFADEGYGYKILAEHHYSSGTDSAQWIELPVKKNHRPRR